MNTLRKIAQRELAVFFATPAAFIFFGAFLAVTLFLFFWVETFFSRNIADVRPMFEWMPCLLIFLSAAITMRVWSEEHRAGTRDALDRARAPIRAGRRQVRRLPEPRRHWSGFDATPAVNGQFWANSTGVRFLAAIWRASVLPELTWPSAFLLVRSLTARSSV